MKAALIDFVKLHEVKSNPLYRNNSYKWRLHSAERLKSLIIMFKLISIMD